MPAKEEGVCRCLVSWCCYRREALLGFRGCAAEGRQRCRGSVVALQDGKFVAEVPGLCLWREVVLPRFSGCAARGR